MKAKKILIMYLNNGDMKNTVAKEILFSELLTEMENEGRKPVDGRMNMLEKEARFDDGSTIKVMPYTTHNLVGMRFTHAYIDENILNAPNGIEAFEYWIKPTVIQYETEKFEAVGTPHDRIFFFSGNGKQILLNKQNTIKGE